MFSVAQLLFISKDIRIYRYSKKEFGRELWAQINNYDSKKEYKYILANSINTNSYYSEFYNFNILGDYTLEHLDSGEYIMVFSHLRFKYESIPLLKNSKITGISNVIGQSHYIKFRKLN